MREIGDQSKLSKKRGVNMTAVLLQLGLALILSVHGCFVRDPEGIKTISFYLSAFFALCALGSWILHS